MRILATPYVLPHPPKKDYPYIGTTTDRLVVLFYAPSTGVILSGGDSGYKSNKYTGLGKHSSAWPESDFKPFYGVVQIDTTE